MPPALSSGSGSPVGSLSALKSAHSEEHIQALPRSDVRLGYACTANSICRLLSSLAV